MEGHVRRPASQGHSSPDPLRAAVHQGGRPGSRLQSVPVRLDRGPGLRVALPHPGPRRQRHDASDEDDDAGAQFGAARSPAANAFATGDFRAIWSNAPYGAGKGERPPLIAEMVRHVLLSWLRGCSELNCGTLPALP